MSVVSADAVIETVWAVRLAPDAATLLKVFYGMWGKGCLNLVGRRVGGGRGGMGNEVVEWTVGFVATHSLSRLLSCPGDFSTRAHRATRKSIRRLRRGCRRAPL